MREKGGGTDLEDTAREDAFGGAVLRDDVRGDGADDLGLVRLEGVERRGQDLRADVQCMSANGIEGIVASTEDGSVNETAYSIKLRLTQKMNAVEGSVMARG